MHEDDQTTKGGFPADLPPEWDVLIGVYFLHWKLDEMLEALELDPPLSKNETHMLINLVPPKRMGEIAAELQVLPSTLTTIADELEGKGLILREQDPDDRRAWRLCLTDLGVQKRDSFIKDVAKLFNEASGLTAAETETISGLMLKAARNIKANGLPEGAKPCQ